MMYSKRHLPDVEQWSQSSGSNVIPRWARPGLPGLRPHTSLPEINGVGSECFDDEPRCTEVELGVRLIAAERESERERASERERES